MSGRYKPSTLCSAAALSLSRPRIVLQATNTARGPSGKPARKSAHVRATEHAPWPAHWAKAVEATLQSTALSPRPQAAGTWSVREPAPVRDDVLAREDVGTQAGRKRA